MDRSLLGRLTDALCPPAPPGAVAHPRRISPLRAYLEVTLVYVLGFGPGVLTAFWYLHHGTVGITTTGPAPTMRSEFADQFWSWSFALAGILPALWLAHRRGWSLHQLGIRPHWATARDRGQAVTAGTFVFLSMFAASVLLSVLAPQASYPDGRVGPWGMVEAVFGSLQAGFAEELIITAFIITTLRQAGRPTLEVLVVTLLARTAYHVYYRTWWVLLWVAIWSGTAFALYLRTRRLTPLIIGHALFDFAGFTQAELGHGGTIAVQTIEAVVLGVLSAVLLRRLAFGSGRGWSLIQRPATE